MRIISGKYKGRNIQGFDIQGTRPTMARVKESLFATIGAKVKNSQCLDLFAGSGALGFEALSVGASFCAFVDQNPKVISVLKKNKENLKIEEETMMLGMDYEKALRFLSEQGKTFDIIFLDPPYDKNLIQPSLDVIKKLNLLNEGGLIICEYEKEIFACELEIMKEKRYGDKRIRIYKK